MQLSALAAFVGVAWMLILLPGPDWAFVLAAGMRERLVVLPAVLGLVTGYGLVTLVVAAGVAPLVAAEPMALVALTVVGAAYLVHLGVGALRAPGGPGADPAVAARPPAPSGELWWRGVGVSALNPKALLFFLAFLPQFARPSAPWPLAVQLLVLGAVWAVIGALFYTALGYTARRTLGAKPRLAQAVTRLAGVAMVLAGVALLGEQLAHALGLG